MRRVLPWALLVVLLVGAGVGAVVGQAATRPGPAPAAAQWIAGVVATTRAAGTAHFTDTSWTTSRVPALRGSSSGSGVVDFATGSVSATDVSHSYELSSTDGGPMRGSVVRNVTAVIAIGRSAWERLGGSWAKSARLRPGDDPLDLVDAPGASVALDAISGAGPVVGIRPLGPATVGGVATTRYLVVRARPTPCDAAQAAALKDFTIGSTTLWVDGAGRLVQVQNALHIDITPPPPALHAYSSGFPTGAEVITTTVRLGDFGAPVHITAPATTSQPFHIFGISGSGRVVSHAHTCEPG